MDKWLNPVSPGKTINKYSSFEPTTVRLILDQVEKKKLSQKTKKERIADKCTSLAERLNDKMINS